MQPTLSTQQTGGTVDMDLTAVQSMDWLFKKERIYLLAQFWQQRATLAEKEVNTLKEQLTTTTPISSATNDIPSNFTASSTSIDTPSIATALQNFKLSSEKNSISSKHLNSNGENIFPGATSPSPPLSESGSTASNNNNNTTNMHNSQDTTFVLGSNTEKKEMEGVNENITVNSSQINLTESDDKTENSLTNKISKDEFLPIPLKSRTPDKNNEKIVAKNDEIKSLIEEVARMQSIQEQQSTRIQFLEEHLKLKEKQISILELQLHSENKIEIDLSDSTVKQEQEEIATPVNPIPNSDANNLQELLLDKPQDIIPPITPILPIIPNEINLTDSNNEEPDNNVIEIGDGGDEPFPSVQHSISPFRYNENNSSLNTQQNLHLDLDKTSSHNSTASTPNIHDDRRSIEEQHLYGGLRTPLSMQLGKPCKIEDTSNALTTLSHLSSGFLPGIPFQFQDRNQFRLSDELHMASSMGSRLGDSLIPKSDPMEAKLQEMLRYNMDKYANQNLDTLHISRRVRELLSVHNIGQRLFAKYILGLSQGTVSELLSKPKPWDKLTEKGRDSYRKMHAWACDDTAVLLLKSLIPKKGSETGMSQFGRPDDNMSDDRMAHIFSEASQIIKPPSSQPQNPQLHSEMNQSKIDRENDSRSNDCSKSPIQVRSTSPLSQQQQNKQDELSQEELTRIYQEKLMKIMSRSQRDSFPSNAMPMMSSTPIREDDICLAFSAYHRELSKIQQASGNMTNFSGLLAMQHQAALALNGSAQDLSVSKDKELSNQNDDNEQIDCSNEQSEAHQKDKSSNEEALKHSSAFNLVRPKQEPGTQANSSTSGTPSTAASPLGNTILPPVMTPTDDFSSAASPLQRMASITNSLITQPPITPHHSQPQRPMKAVLPPITQQQFDMFNNLNTEDIVRRVKEALSQYSISQRLFGESVLGLSQGSVSDLLARPKPWHMLTQKGREPFIRMKMFLEDENAVHKLVASQYKIAPEKLMRTGNYSGSPQIPSGIANKMPNLGNIPMQKIMNDFKMQESQSQHLMQQMQASVINHIPTSQHQGMLLTPPGMPPQHAISLTHNQQSEKKSNIMIPTVHSPQQPHPNAMRGMHQHMSPTVYEMAALTQDLDTQVITTKIKEALLANNIGQKIFGEAVLGLSQGSVSELLSKPKPWHMLSIKGREPFIRMQLWLSDINNVERLQVIKNERREASKRRRSTGPGNQDNSSDTSSNDTADFYTNSPGPGSVGSAGAPPNKKQRVLFSEEQKEALRLAFALDPYPNVATIEFLANELGLATRTITNWFHNHRMRLKQQVPHTGTKTDPLPSRENTSNAPFDPVQFKILLSQRLMELHKERIGLSGVPIPYPPYFASNPNLVSILGRGFLPTSEAELQALNAAFKEQINGLDLSMSNNLRRDGDEDFDDEVDEEENDNDISGIESLDNERERDNDPKEELLNAANFQSRTSRRKPVAPQWVNPDWQGEKGSENTTILKNLNVPEEIINGVCIMQQASDLSRKNDTEENNAVPSNSLDVLSPSQHSQNKFIGDQKTIDNNENLENFNNSAIKLEPDADCNDNNNEKIDSEIL